MPRFFNRIRKQLAKGNKFFQYSRYAIGEILLVVIGILIALQIGDWSQRAADRKLETEYLQRFAVDLNRDLELVEMVEGFLVRKEASLKKVREFIDYPTTMFVDSVMFTLRESTIIGTDLPNVRLTGTIQEIISSGHLRLIQNTELRNSIVNYYSAWEHQNLRLDRKQSDYPDLVFQIVDRDTFFKENPLHKGKSLKGVLFDLEIEALFYRHFMKEVNYLVFTDRIIQGRKNNLETIQALIREELKKIGS